MRIPALCSLAACIALVACSSPPSEEVTASAAQAASCGPQMTRFPVNAPHNIGYDHASCGTGTCATSCPDANANSDHSAAAGHHGIDIFAHHGADLVATANGTIVKVGWASASSGLRVTLRDDCGWEYFYGHLDDAVVSVGQYVSAGQLIGHMGGSADPPVSIHTHFNVSDGGYYNDIDPIQLLVATSPTACGAAPSPSPAPAPIAPPAAPTACGRLLANEGLTPGQVLTSCGGGFHLVMQTDGNLVVYQAGGGAWWSSGTHGTDAHTAVLQGDGNFVVYGATGIARWAAGTHGTAGAALYMQDDGNLVVYAPGGAAVWSTW